jgi:DnaK suppressor protein
LADDTEIRRTLVAERDGLRGQLGELTAVPRDPMAAVSFGKRVGEGTTQAVERIAQVATAKQLDAKLRDVERALAKLDDGTYGICDRCGRLIPEVRLEARPWSVLCVDCASLRTRSA